MSSFALFSISLLPSSFHSSDIPHDSFSSSSGRAPTESSAQPHADEEEDPEVVAASRAAASGAATDPAAAEAANARGRSVASVGSDRSADRSLDDLDDGAPGAGTMKKDKKKEKSKSGLLKGLFGSKKHKVRFKSCNFAMCCV